MSDNKIKILVVDDHPILREGIKTVLELSNDFIIVGEADSGFKACELVPTIKPDVVLMDIRMDKMDGIKASRTIKKLYPYTRILLLTMYDDENYIMEALEIGVEGYILKMSEVEKVIAAIKLINEGETYFDPKITRSITERSKAIENQKQPEDLLRKYDLTSREIEIINYTINGLSTKQIAEKLFISPNTVYNHRRNIFHKLKINRSSELISFAINNNLFLISGK